MEQLELCLDTLHRSRLETVELTEVVENLIVQLLQRAGKEEMMDTKVDKLKLKRIVIKVGTSSLTYPSGKIHLRKLEELITVLSDLKNRGLRSFWFPRSHRRRRRENGLCRAAGNLPGKQAVRRHSQCELMYLYDKFFSQFHVK